MVAILRKIQADLFNRRLAAGLVTLTILAATALLALTAITLSNLNRSFERSFDELRGAHLWLFFDRSLTSRLAVEHGCLVLADGPGWGVTVDRHALDDHLIAPPTDLRA